MSHLTKTCRSEEGSVIVLAFVLLVVLTLIGIFATRTATLDIQVASNEIPYKQNFYTAEGGVHREAAEVSRGSYPIANVRVAQTLATQTSGALPSPTPHQVAGNSYNFRVDYPGFFPPPAGYSTLHFSRYDYQIQASRGDVRVRARYFKVGPKAE